jgi:hypothetical protein
VRGSNIPVLADAHAGVTTAARQVKLGATRPEEGDLHNELISATSGPRKNQEQIVDFCQLASFKLKLSSLHLTNKW